MEIRWISSKFLIFILFQRNLILPIKVGEKTNHYQTQCFSTHLTKFASGFLIVPEMPDWKYIFANADFMKNKTIYLTVISVSIIYMILIIYARFYDKKDLEKLGVTPLSDNHQADKYYYQILVFTGQRKDSGTKSKVNFREKKRKDLSIKFLGSFCFVR
jgi:hypothetical protein